MSKLPEIVEDFTEDNQRINEKLKRMEGKTIKKVRGGSGKTSQTLHHSDVLHIEFTDGEILAVNTGSNVTDFRIRSKIDPNHIHVHLLFTWHPDRHTF